MNGIIASLDIVSSLSLLACIILISLRPVRDFLSRDLCLVIAAYFLVGLLYQISLTLEWTGITDVLDPFEDYIQLLQPLLLVFFLYSYIQGRAAEDKSEEEKRHQMLFNAGVDAIFFQQIDRGNNSLRCIDANDLATETFGYTQDEYLDAALYELCAPAVSNVRHVALMALGAGERVIFEDVFDTKDGRSVPVEVVSLRYVHAGESLIISVVRDLTSQKKLENEIRHSQRMESVGRLAGGIAHDFNNILTVITGYSDLVLNAMSEDNELRDDVAEIRRSADRAVSLTKQLLAFSRKQVLQPKLISPGDVLDRTEQLLKRLIGEDLRLEVASHDDGARFLADPSQIEQVVMNLAVNARDAMPAGGALVFGSRQVAVSASQQALRPEIPVGQYVLIECTDTGTGMDSETLSHIFEPFYTTKERGKGTGLGLSTAYGIVKQSDGFIYVTSELGKGTTFELYFPVADTGEIPVDPSLEVHPVVGGSETILLVEDESSVREYASNILRKVGYHVIEARDGEEALEKSEELGTELDLVISDVVMPRINGIELLDHLSELNPEVKIILITGYAGDEVITSQLPKNYRSILSKPFSSGDLLEMIAKVLRR